MQESCLKMSKNNYTLSALHYQMFSIMTKPVNKFTQGKVRFIWSPSEAKLM